MALAPVDYHTRHCVLGAAPSNQEATRAKLMDAIARLVPGPWHPRSLMCVSSAAGVASVISAVEMRISA